MRPRLIAVDDQPSPAEVRQTREASMRPRLIAVDDPLISMRHSWRMASLQ